MKLLRVLFFFIFIPDVGFTQTRTSFLNNTNLQCISTAIERSTGHRPSEKFLFLLASASNYRFCWRSPASSCTDSTGRRPGNMSDARARERLMDDVLRRLQIYGYCSGANNTDANANFNFRDDGSWMIVSPVLTGTYRPGWGTMETMTHYMGFKNGDDYDRLFNGGDIYQGGTIRSLQEDFDRSLDRLASRARRGGRRDPTTFGGICAPESGNWLRSCLFELDAQRTTQGPRIPDTLCRSIAQECHISARVCDPEPVRVQQPVCPETPTSATH